MSEQGSTNVMITRDRTTWTHNRSLHRTDGVESICSMDTVVSHQARMQWGNARAFTIAELIVAIGVTVVLIIGISRIFSMSGKTVAIGQATAEVSQNEQALERLIRQDFMNITRHGFLMIRNERIGPDAWSSEEYGNYRENIYLNSDAEEDDAGLGTRRIDQIVFFATGNYPTYQFRSPFTSEGEIARNDTSSVSRIWYGHGFRRPGMVHAELPDDRLVNHPEEFEIKADIGPNGYYDSLGGVRFADVRSGDNADTVNKHAQQWMLGRQATLMLPRDHVSNHWELSFVTSVFEFFNELGSNQYAYPFSELGSPYDHTLPEFRNSPGYTDMVDCDLPRLEKQVTEYGECYNIETGETDLINDPMGGLWQVDAEVTDDVLRNYYYDHLDLIDQDRIDERIADYWMVQQRRRMRLARGRIRLETAVPSPYRYDQMLTHASLLPGCSDFRVQWSTGKIDPMSGNVVWYDIDNPANPYIDVDDGKSVSERRREAPDDPTIWFLSELPDYYWSTPEYKTEWEQEGSFREDQAEDLYYATFGYFVPMEKEVDEPDDRSELWPWPTMIRITVTLHDDRGILTNGRTYQFEIPLNVDPKM